MQLVIKIFIFFAKNFPDREFTLSGNADKKEEKFISEKSYAARRYDLFMTLQPSGSFTK